MNGFAQQNDLKPGNMVSAKVRDPNNKLKKYAEKAKFFNSWDMQQWDLKAPVISYNAAVSALEKGAERLLLLEPLKEMRQ